MKVSSGILAGICIVLAVTRFMGSDSSLATGERSTPRVFVPKPVVSHEDSLEAGFKNPPPGYGPVPLWWWNGDPLTRKRISWQLDQLHAKGVNNLCVIYAHSPDGKTLRSSPEIFTSEWWDIWRWTVAECKKRGMTLGFSDYVWVWEAQEKVGKTHPELRGAVLDTVSVRIEGPITVTLAIPENRTLITASAIRLSEGEPVKELVSLPSGAIKEGALVWNAPEGAWRVVAVVAVPTNYDPTNPAAAEKMIDSLYAVFEQHSWGEVGKAVNYFFQDELVLGAGGRMPFWSPRLREEFRRRKGYDLVPLLPALWFDIGPKTSKIRIDYSDAAVSLLEEGFFKPIYAWHEKRGTIFGHDQGGRGTVIGARQAYGDYFRTMRWYSAPGYDDWSRGDLGNFRDGKLAASIAHLYGRPRVWLEGFHSTGWGLTPSRMIAWTNENYAFGATLYDPHGLYYTTYGGWWEWAPPDMHFRQPYWEHTAGISAYHSRVSWLLSRGVHRCDVAVLYPITTVEAGIGSEVAENDFYRLSSFLFYRGIDLDFIDNDSIERSEIRGNELCVSGERYRIILLASPGAVRWNVLEKLLAFIRSGGIVIAHGRLPEASDRAGGNDPYLETMLHDIFGLGVHEAENADSVVDTSSPNGGRGIFIPEKVSPVVLKWSDDGISIPTIANDAGGELPVSCRVTAKMIETATTRDFIPSSPDFLALHRVIENRDVYFINNYRGETKEAELFFRSTGGVEEWNPWTGGRKSVLSVRQVKDGTRIQLRFAPREAKILVFDPSKSSDSVSFEENTLDIVESVNDDGAHLTVKGYTRSSGEHRAVVRTHNGLIRLKGTPRDSLSILALDGEWETEPHPTMDNRFGDFKLPPSPGLIGPEIRRFRYSEEHGDVSGWHTPHFDDSSWVETTFSYGPRLWKIGPLPKGTPLAEIESRIIGNHSVTGDDTISCGGKPYRWTPHEFSLQWGIERDPFLLDWLTGPHGLKQAVPDEFIDLGDSNPGAVWYLWTTVHAPAPTEGTLFIKAQSAVRTYPTQYLPLSCSAWVNGRTIDTSSGMTKITLNGGVNRLILKFIQPEQGRLRAYAVIRQSPPPDTHFPLRWFSSPGWMDFDCQSSQQPRTGWYRFTAPPGLRAMNIPVFGELTGAWVDGEKTRNRVVRREPDGGTVYRVQPIAPRAQPSQVTLRISHAPGRYSGAAIYRPIDCECAAGKARLGEWSEIGLSSYSGGMWYRKDVILSKEHLGGKLWLDLGGVSATAEVRINGKRADVLVTPPWRVDITPFVRTGNNRVEILVANTLANHYSIGIPSLYVFPGQTTSGLLGPVRIEIWPEVVLRSQ